MTVTLTIRKCDPKEWDYPSARWEWLAESIDADGRTIERRYGPARTKAQAQRDGERVRKAMETTTQGSFELQQEGGSH